MICSILIFSGVCLYIYLFRKSIKAQEERDRKIVEQWFNLYIKDLL